MLAWAVLLAAPLPLASLRLHPPAASSPRHPAVLCQANGAARFSRLASPEGVRQAAELQRELARIAVKQDPQVVLRRSLDLARALRTVGGEVLPALATPPPPQLVLRRLFEELGATYIKLGQFIASSPTLFPPEYVREFQRCLDTAPPMAWGTVKSLLEAELGRPVESVFSRVEQTPLAAASIAQVHAATLRTGEDVVIKVQKRGVEKSLQADLDLLYAISRVLQLLGVVTSELSEVVQTLRDAILEETDFVLEATRTEQFAQFLDRSDLRGVVTVPAVYRSASSKRILTLERLYGVPLTDLESVRKYTPEPELVLIIALNTWISSVLTNEWFHADVHAGNLLVLKDGRVAFIDFGIVGAIPKKTASAMLDFVQAYSAADMAGIAAALSGMGFTRDGIDVEAFAKDLREVLDSLEAMPADQMAAGQVDETQLNRLVASFAKVAEGYGIRFPREFALLLKQVLYFDRYTKLLAPNIDVMSDERISSMNMRSATADGSDGGKEDLPAVGARGQQSNELVIEPEVLQ